VSVKRDHIRRDPSHPSIRTLDTLSRQLGRGELDFDGPDGGFVTLIDVVGDLGRSLTPTDADGLVGLLPFLASVRERLEEHNDPQFGEVARTPKQALQDPKLSAAYAAGALWASTSIIHGAIERGEREDPSRPERASRAAVRDLILDLVERNGTVRPSHVADEVRARGQGTDRSTISRAFSDLIADGTLTETDPPLGDDRRARYYTRASQPSDLAASHILGLLRRSLQELAQAVPDQTQVHALVDRELALLSAPSAARDSSTR